MVCLPQNVKTADCSDALLQCKRKPPVLPLFLMVMLINCAVRRRAPWGQRRRWHF